VPVACVVRWVVLQGAAEGMIWAIWDSYNKFTTNMYDYIQLQQQDIFYWRGQQQGGVSDDL